MPANLNGSTEVVTVPIVAILPMGTENATVMSASSLLPAQPEPVTPLYVPAVYPAPGDEIDVEVISLL